MTVEEKAYNYASKVVKNRLTASEVAAHYGRGYIEGQEDMKHLGWHPASELPPVDKNGNSGELIAITSDNNLMRVYFHYESDEYNFWVESDDWNKQVKYGVNVKQWCYPPLND